MLTWGYSRQSGHREESTFPEEGWGIAVPRLTDDERSTRLALYVDSLKRSGAVRSEAVRQAFLRVPRHELVDHFYLPRREYSTQHGYEELSATRDGLTSRFLDAVYSNASLVTAFDDQGMPSSSSSMPGLMAQMLELLRVQPGLSVLEIGTGTGYNAALLAELVGDQALVSTIEIQSEVAERARRLLTGAGYADIEVFVGDGYHGLPDRAPFDRIVATAALPDVSPEWSRQLRSGGELLLPIYHGNASPLIRLSLDTENRLRGRIAGLAGFMPIQGHMGSSAPPLKNTPPDRLTESPARVETTGWSFDTSIGTRVDCWFFMSAAEPNVTLRPVPGSNDSQTWTDWTFGLGDGNASAVVDSRGDIVSIGEDDAPLLKLRSLYERWETLGRPRMGEFELEFIPRSSAPTTANALLREYHWQVFTLAGEPVFG
jgi:protein-L-isoaspartate(D-aspartate) O-methyltransferase